MLKKWIAYLVIFISFIFPLAYVKGFAFPGIFPHVMLFFAIVEIILLLYVYYSISRGEIVYKKSYLTFTLLAYIAVLFISALLGADFNQSFWSSYSRMTGITTWLHVFALFFVASAILGKEMWKYVFRGLIMSGLILALVAFLGRDGLALKSFLLISKQGGSILGNTSYNGLYLVLIVFISFIGYSFETRKLWKILYAFSILFIFFNPDLFNFGIFNGSTTFAQLKDNPMLALGLARASTLVLWGGLLVSMIFWGLHKIKNKKTVIFFAALALLIALFSSFYSVHSIMSGKGKIYELYVSESGLARPMVWNMADKASKERPWLGYGNENFDYVYQDNLDVKIMHLEDPEWFGKAHNIVLDELINTGYIGTILMFIIFCLICYTSLRLYILEKRFYFLIIPFIFLFYFLQTQTFFITDSALFLLFLLLAFLVSHEQDMSIRIPWRKYSNWYYVVFTAIILIAFIFFVSIPIQQNTLLPRISNAEKRGDRIALYPSLTKLKHAPVETLRSLGGSFTNETARRARELQEQGLTEKVKEEYGFYIEAYKTYYTQYENNYRYLIEHGRMINSASIFKIDELKYGEELLRKALDVSTAYPHAYWLLAENLYYQGKLDEALETAREGYDIDPSIKQSIFLYEFVQKQAKSPNSAKSFIYISDL